MNSPSTEIEALAKKAIEAVRHLREDYGLDTPGWTGAEIAMRWARDEYRSAATPEAWLTLSARNRELEAALKEERGKALEEAAFAVEYLKIVTENLVMEPNSPYRTRITRPATQAECAAAIHALSPVTDNGEPT